MEISIGDYVEVCSKEDGLWGSYFEAKVIAKKGKDTYTVEYQTLMSDKDETKKLKERVQGRDLRPCPPKIRAKEYDLLQKVDAYDNDGWWVGRVTGRSSEDKYLVYFDCSGDEFEYYEYQLRVHCEWEGGRWIPSSCSQKRT